MYNPRGMWSDGWVNPNPLEAYGFDQYQLKHYCFGGDGDDGGGGGEYGQDDPQPYDPTPTPEDYGAFEEAVSAPLGAWHDPAATWSTDDPEKREYRDILSRTPERLNEQEIEKAADFAASTRGRLSPYHDPGMKEIITGLGEDTGFTPEFGLDPFEGSQLPSYALEQDRFGTFPYHRSAKNIARTPKGATSAQFNVDYDQDYEDRVNRLAESYGDARRGSTDILSSLGGLVGIQSPVEFDPNKGFYEGTEFDFFDAPLIQAVLSGINPGLGALYGLGKGITKGDPVGALTSLVGPFSKAAPLLNMARLGRDVKNLWTGGNETFSDLFGVPGKSMDTGIDWNRESLPAFDPGGIFKTSQGLADKVRGALSNLNPSDPFAGGTYNQPLREVEDFGWNPDPYGIAFFDPDRRSSFYSPTFGQSPSMQRTPVLGKDFGITDPRRPLYLSGGIG